jgi:protein SCO1/2
MRLLAFLILCTGVFLAGCSREDGAAASGSDDIIGSEGTPVRGVVLAVLPERDTVRFQVDGSEAREFIVDGPTLALMSAGSRYHARVVNDGPRQRLAGVWPEELRDQPELAAAAAALRKDTDARGSSAYRTLGEKVPEFVLVDQDNRIVRASDLRGSWLVVNFIFTRCQVPEMCPASTAKMVSLQRDLAAAGIGGVRLISITLDPSHDSPSALSDYAELRGIDTRNFSLLTGPEQAIADLLRQFGIRIAPGDNVLRHTASTLLVNPEGRIVYREDGARWKPENFRSRIPTG